MFPIVRLLKMTKHRFWLITGVILIVVILGLVIRNQVKVYRGRQARAALNRARAAVIEQRQTLFDLVQPIAISNCQLERFGEANDGGYLMCGNLLGGIESGYRTGSPDTTSGAAISRRSIACPSTNMTASSQTGRRVQMARPFFTRNALET